MNYKIKEIKNYWETRTPQPWYSNKKKGTREFYEDIEQFRYKIRYPYLPKVWKFTKHKDESVLEIGCGLGTELIQFAKNGAKCTGVDLTENAIIETKKRFELYGLNGTFQVANAEDLPFKDNSFNLVTSFGVLHHTPNTRKAIHEAIRVAKDKVIIMLYSKSTWYWKLVIQKYLLNLEFLNGSLQNCLNKNTEHFGNCPLTKFYSKKEIKKLFKGYNITYLERKGIGNLHKKILFKKIERFIGNNWIIKVSKS